MQINNFIICAAVAFLVLVHPPLASSSETKEDAIRELLEVMKTMENMETSLTTMKDTIKMNAPYFLKEIKVLLSRDLEDKKVQQAADKYKNEDFGANRLYELFRHKLDLKKIENEVMLPVYSEHYNKAEIRELITFYRSEIGQKTLRLTSVISRSISTKTRDISHVALTQAKEELASELKKELKQ